MECNQPLIEELRKKIINGLEINNDELYLDQNRNPIPGTRSDILDCIYDDNKFIIQLLKKYIKGDLIIENNSLEMISIQLINKYIEGNELENNVPNYLNYGLLNDFIKKIKELSYNRAYHSNIEEIIEKVKTYIEFNHGYGELWEEIDKLIAYIGNNNSENNYQRSRPLGANKKTKNKKSKNKKSKNKKSKKSKKNNKNKKSSKYRSKSSK